MKSSPIGKVERIEEPVRSSVSGSDIVDAVHSIKYQGESHSRRISPCILTKDDIRRIGAELLKLAIEAMEKHLTTIQRPHDQNEVDWQAFLDEIREKRSLTILIIGRSGEEVGGNSLELLEDVNLPNAIQSIVFDSSAAMQSECNVQLANRFRVTIDLSEPPSIASYDPWSTSTPNLSSIEVRGTDRTWVRGALQRAEGPFRERRTSRGWLHAQGTYNIYHWALAFPLSLWVTAIVDSLTYPRFLFSDAIRVILNIYVSLLMMLMFRFVMAALRWLFPIIEVKGSRNGFWRGVGATVLTSLVLSVLGRVLWAVITGNL